MIIIGWNALFGRTDKVDGLFYVGTSFFHIFFIPLIPLGSYIVRKEDDNWLAGFKGVSIGWSIKSVLYAWARAAAVVTILVEVWKFLIGWWSGPSYVDGRGMVGDLDVPGWTGVLIIAGCLIALWVMRVTSVASPARAAELMNISGYRLEQAPAKAA